MVNRVNSSHFNHEESRKCRIERGNRKKSPNMLSLVWKYFGWTYNRHNRFNGNNLLLLSNISIFAIVLFTVPLVLLVLPLCRPFFRSEKLNTQHRRAPIISDNCEFGTLLLLLTRLFPPRLFNPWNYAGRVVDLKMREKRTHSTSESKVEIKL